MKCLYTRRLKGEGELKILYVTPEKISKSKRFMSKLEKCHRAGHLSLMAIDEAHSCSQWGHNFWPDHKNLLEDSVSRRSCGCFDCNCYLESTK
ncbi:hypothetical protein NL676_039866 [Syzygium grande]|nr:hypothetical protein NL676_039866 [Syzygium grande]